MKRILLLLSVFALFAASCKKHDKYTTPSVDVTITTDPAKRILIDASKGGGIGAELTLYLHKTGFQVMEMRRGTVVTSDLLKTYTKIIRTSPYLDYSQDEINAYAEWLKGPNSLLLIPKISGSGDDDGLSKLLGITFPESVSVEFRQFVYHDITNGVQSLEITWGRMMVNPDPSVITSLASSRFYDDDMIAVFNGTALGIVKHPTSKIVFIGSLSAIDKAQQPLTDNMIKWLFK